MNDEGSLDALAAAIADGDEVNWNAVLSEQPDPIVSAVVGNLRVLATIAVEHRNATEEPIAPRFTESTWNQLRIIGRIGGGAFGEVYRAWDSQLEREVALKLVPVGGSTSRSGGLGEARLLARVRHPNVVTVHGAAIAEGFAGLWMELIEGRTLRKIVEDDGPFGAHETVIAGLAICRALGAVHGAGLLHGDVKAQNVMRERGGRIVLMDLGAARMRGSEPDDVPVAATPLYVAPEVLAGGPPDVRSDVYSLGVVLFFLLTSRFPHAGEDAAGILESQARGDGHALRQLRTDLPDALVSVVERCVALAPEARFEHAAAVEQALAHCLSPQVPRETPPWWTRRPVRIAAAILLVVAGGLSIAWRVNGWGAGTRRQPLRVHSVIALSPAVANTYGPWLALSARGDWIAYRAADAFLYVRRADRLDGIRVPRSFNGQYPFFSPDEQWLGFFATGMLRKYSLVDGTVVPLAEAPNPRGGTWTHDNWLIYTPEVHAGLWRVSAAGGKPEQITSLLPDQASHRWPAALPDGKIAVTLWPSHGDVLGASVAIVDPARDQWWTIDKGTRPQYTHDGILTYGREGEILATHWDPSRPESTKRGVALQNTVLTDEQTGYVEYGISDVSLVYVRGSSNAEQRRLVWVDQRGVAEPTRIPARSIERPRLAPDGRQVAFVVRERRTDVYHYDLDRNVLTQVTAGAAAEYEAPVWSPDGAQLVYSRWTYGSPRAIVVQRPDHSAPAATIATTETHDHVSAWSTDGLLMTTVFNDRGLGDINVLAAAPGAKPRTFLATEANERDGQPSPDQAWVLYTSDESGVDQVYVRERHGGRRIQISSDGGSEPIWQSDGRAIFYRSASALMKVQWPLVGSASQPKPLFRDVYVRSTRREVNYAVTRDGSRFLMVECLPPPDRPVSLVIGWPSDLESRLARASH
jgi:hypothetical protein